MSDAHLHRVDLLYQHVLRHQEEIGKLEGEIRRLRNTFTETEEELATLHDCLAEVGVLRRELFLAQLHRRRFASYAFISTTRFDDAIYIEKITLAVSLLAGPTAVRMMGQVSKAVAITTRKIWPVVKDACPGHVYVCGGADDLQGQSLTSVRRFFPTTGAWGVLPPMRQRRAYASAGVLGGRLYICGGVNHPVDGPLLKSVECFNVASASSNGEWEEVSSMSVARKGASAAVLSGKLYVCGGVDDSMHTLTCCESFHPSSGHWEIVPPMLESRGYLAACALQGRLYACGGRAVGGRHLSSAEYYDPGHGKWFEVQSMFESRMAAQAAVFAGKLYICGGLRADLGAGHAQALRTAECYDPQVGWSLVAEMHEGRSFAAFVGAVGGLYVFGGFSHGQCMNSAERFDPKKGQWSRLRPMSERRAGGVAVIALL